MDFKALYSFLRDLEQHNSKDWMDQHRKKYKALRTDFISWLDELNTQIETWDTAYYNTPGKRGINRINNNLMFHPNKPIYKDHFGGGLDKAPGTADFYIEIGPNGSLLAGGFWRPDPKTLRSIRDGIDYDGEKLQEILTKDSFKGNFGELYKDVKLKNAPKGFSNDHPHIELLKHKTFAVVHHLKDEEVFQQSFKEKIITVYKEMLPFRRYLNQCATV